jgi:hypothetical protein
MRPGKAKGPSTNSGTGGAPPVVPSYIIGTSKRITNAMSPYTVLSTDTSLLCDTTAGNIVLQLPAIAVMGDRVIFAKMDIGANAVSILPNGAETIDGFPSYSISILNESVALQAALATPATKWQALARYSQFRANDSVENWTALDANWTYDGDENFTNFPGYLASNVVPGATNPIWAPAASAFTPYPRVPTGAFPVHVHHKIRSLAIAGVNTSLATSYMLNDVGFVGDWVGMIWAFIDLAGQNEYLLEIDTQKNSVPGTFLYHTGITLSADREDDFEFVIYPDHVECYFNGQLVYFESGFNFQFIAYVDVSAQAVAVDRQGLINRTEIYTQAPNR